MDRWNDDRSPDSPTGAGEPEGRSPEPETVHLIVVGVGQGEPVPEDGSGEVGSGPMPLTGEPDDALSSTQSSSEGSMTGDG